MDDLTLDLPTWLAALDAAAQDDDAADPDAALFEEEPVGLGSREFDPVCF